MLTSSQVAVDLRATAGRRRSSNHHRPEIGGHVSFVHASASLFVLASAILLLAGCASTPPSALPSLQQHVTNGGAPAVGWPQKDADKAEIEKATSTLLAQDLTAETAVQVALLNNRSLRATLEEIGLSQADLIEASRLHNPTLGASVRWPNHAPRGPNVEFSLAFELLDGLLIPLRKKIAAHELERTTRRVAHEVLTLAADVKAAVYTYQSHQQLLARVSAIRDVNASAADLAQRQYNAGNINQLELAQLQSTTQRDELELLRLTNLAQSDRERLHRLLGLARTPTWKISAPLTDLPATDPTTDILEDLAVKQRHDLAAARMEVELAQSAYDLKRRTRLLPVSMSAGADTERESHGERLTGPSLELGLPIFDQGQADLARFSAQWRRATAQAEGLEANIRSEVRSAINDLRFARKTAEFYAHTLLPQRTLILRETLLHYNAMQKSNYELLAAKEQQLAAERENLEALRDYWIARARLEQAVGGQLP